MSSENYLQQLEEYAAELLENFNSKTPVVHAPVVWSYQHPEVRTAIAARLAAGQVLVRSAKTIPDIVLKRERAYFDFAPPGRLDARLPGILVQLNEDNSLFEVVDPIDPGTSSILARPTMDATLPLHAASSSPVPALAAPTLDQRWFEFLQDPVFDVYRESASGRNVGLVGRLFGFGGTFGGTGTSSTDTWTGGTPYPTPVISSPSEPEQPDRGETGGRYDDSSPDDFAVFVGETYPTHKLVFPGGPLTAIPQRTDD